MKNSLLYLWNTLRKGRPFLIGTFLLIFISTLSVSAQQRSISGKITGADGVPIVGATVLVEGTLNGVISDADGFFSIIVNPDDRFLLISFVGMKETRVEIGDASSYDIALEEDILGLEEIVVVGYGTQRKGELSSSVASVKSDDFIKGAVKDAAQLIQGKVAGLSVSTVSGNPSGGTQIMLRGITTLSAGTSPLVLIDGIPGGLNSVAPEDIESIDVLKDGSAAAIYGTRGTNGVILITTKKVRGDMPATVEYSGYTSVQTISRQATFLNADDYRRLITEGEPLNDFGYSTDWLDEITRTPISQMHNLSMKGGNLATNYVATLNYNQTQGLFKKSDNERINARLEVNHSLLDGMIKLNGGVIGNISSYFNVYQYRQALIRNPTDAVKDIDGNWVEHPGVFQYENPVAWNEETFGDNRNSNIRLHGSLLIEPVAGLRLKLLGSSNRSNYMSGYSETKNHISNVRDGRNGYASRSTGSSVSNLLEITAEYNRTIEKHTFRLLSGYSYQDYTGENFNMSNYDFPTDAFSYNNMSQGDALARGDASMDSYKSSSILIGFFGRVNYSYDNRYIVMASIRREGSSKFGENYQWGMFPAVSAGWRISNESFMDGISFIDDLKIRAGYGITGTEPSSPYQSLTLLRYSGRVLVNGEWVQQIVPASNPNPDLRWEKKTEINAGLDFSVLNGLVSGSVDYYIRQTKDMLWNYQVPTPPYLYSSILANVGEMENKGVEALINIVPIKTSDIQWVTTFSFSTNVNKLVSLSNDLYQTSNDWFETGYTGDPIQQSTHRVQIGEAIGNFWGVKSIDIDDSGVWIIEGADGNPKSIVDKTEDDKQVLGNGLPKHYASWNNSFTYKNFDLNITMRGAFGFQILNFQRLFYENPTINIRYNVLASAYDNVYDKEVLTYTQEYVSYYIEDGDYWKVDNITLGYNFNVENISFLKNARVYFSALNLATITGYKGIDPEVNRIGLNPGNDERDKYPTTRTFSFGVNLTF